MNELKYQDGVSFKPGTLRSICGWCQQEGKITDLGTIDGEGQEGVSHGICKQHTEKLLKQT